MIKYFYMLCTDDKYELPVATFEGINELSRYLGRDKSSVVCSVSRGSRLRHNGKLYKIVKMPIKRKDDLDENDCDL